MRFMSEMDRSLTAFTTGWADAQTFSNNAGSDFHTTKEAFIHEDRNFSARTGRTGRRLT